jgi:hypothetical protein
MGAITKARLATLGVGVCSVAMLASTTAAHAASTVRWEMNEASGATTMTDSGGGGVTGSIGSLVKKTGSSYQWPFVQALGTKYLPERLVRVGDNPALDPDGASFTVELRLKSKQNFVNIIQKGQSGNKGGYWKFETDRGEIKCLFRGPNRTVTAWSNMTVATDTWQTVSCTHTPQGVTMRVNGTVTGSRSGNTGPINNAAALSIGGKIKCDQVSIGCDYYSGLIDYVRISKT